MLANTAELNVFRLLMSCHSSIRHRRLAMVYAACMRQYCPIMPSVLRGVEQTGPQKHSHSHRECSGAGVPQG